MDPEMAAFVEEQIAAGEATSASELLRTLLERHRDEVRKEKWLLEALDKGLKSPRDPRSHDEIWDDLFARHGIARQ